jgi:plasmid stability protein
MASITVRNLDDQVKHRLRRQAAENGRSLEAEIREILRRSADLPNGPGPKTGLDLFRGLREVVKKHGGVELEIPARTPLRDLPFQEEGRPFRHPEPEKRRPRRRK